MTKQELTRLRTLLSALPDSELVDLGMMCTHELETVKRALASVGDEIVEARKWVEAK